MSWIASWDELASPKFSPDVLVEEVVNAACLVDGKGFIVGSISDRIRLFDELHSFPSPGAKVGVLCCVEAVELEFHRENGLSCGCSDRCDLIDEVHISVADSAEEDIKQYFELAADFCASQRDQDRTVFCHCAMGISRSITISLAALCEIRFCSVSKQIPLSTQQDVVDLVTSVAYRIRNQRAVAYPNAGFLEQLAEWSAKRFAKGLTESSDRLMSRLLQELKACFYDDGDEIWCPKVVSVDVATYLELTPGISKAANLEDAIATYRRSISEAEDPSGAGAGKKSPDNVPDSEDDP